MKVLANDGIAQEGKKILEDAGFEVSISKIPQEELASKIHEYDVLIVRSATKVNREILTAAKGKIKLVVRAGVGVDNIDLAAAKEMDIDIANTPLSSSLSVAELVFAHLFSLSRFLQASNREMAGLTNPKFNDLKKQFSDGFELRGKTIGFIGFGRIGQEAAKIALSLGMNVIYHDNYVESVKLRFEHLPFEPVPTLDLTSVSLNELLKSSDIISLHVPFNKGMTPIINTESLSITKDGVCIINCARGGVVDESALLDGLRTGKISCAGLDVFEDEPNVRTEIQNHHKISLTPHIGASTKEAQERISLEVAQVIKHKFSKN